MIELNKSGPHEEGRLHGPASFNLHTNLCTNTMSESRAKLQPRNPNGLSSHGSHFWVGYAPTAKLISDSRLSMPERFLGMALLTWMDFGGIVTLPQTQIANLIGTSQGNVSRRLRALEKLWYIRLKKVGRNTIVRINPHVAWKGSIEEGNRKRAAWSRYRVAVEIAERRAADALRDRAA